MRSDRRAFTLLEVLIALGIFAFAALGLLLAMQSALDGASATQRDSRVRNGLQNRLASLSVGSLRPLGEDEVEDGVNYHMEVQREEVVNDEKTILRGFWRISVRAEWKAGSEPQVWEASHLVYRSDG
jgi:prepilin-type N-terminal cleavage/methylation domain-containing protein